MSLKPAACNIITDSNCTSSGLHNLSTRSWGNIRGSVGLLLHQTINTNIYLFVFMKQFPHTKKKEKRFAQGTVLMLPEGCRLLPTKPDTWAISERGKANRHKNNFFFYNFYTSLKWHNNEKAINEFSAWMTSWQASKGMHNFEDTCRYLNNSIS